MSRLSKSCMESRPSLESGDAEGAKVLDFGTKPRSRSTSVASSATSMCRDLGLCTEFVNVRKLLTTLSLMDCLSNPVGGPLLLSRSNITTVQIATFNLWISISRWLRHCSEMISGCSRLSLLSNGTIAIPTTQQAFACVTALRSVRQLKLACTFVDLTGTDDV